MTLTITKRDFKFLVKDQYIAFIKKAVNVSMDEVIYSNSGANKTVITDGLATCAAVALYGSDGACSMAFTHLSSANSEKDDKRKKRVLNEMLAYVLKNNSLSAVKLVISPSRVLEKHLISFILEWANQKKIACSVLVKGGDSAVFNIDKEGRVLMLSTSLKIKQKTSDKTWYGHGVVMSQNEDHIMLEQPKKNHAFFKVAGAPAAQESPDNIASPIAASS